MASPRTALTELGTAVGLVYEPSAPWPESVEVLEIPGLGAEQWRPVVLPATTPGAANRELLLAAMANGRAFRRVVLGGRAPRRIHWTGADRSVWSSEIPRDLTVDGVYFIQAKHDSTCVLNTAPGSVFEHLLAETDRPAGGSWFSEVAPLELQAYYDAVRHHAGPGDLPADVDALSRADRDALKRLLRTREQPGDEEEDRYRELCEAVSKRSANHWVVRLGRATPAQRTRMLLRMLRLAGGPYWLLGTKGAEPLRLEVVDTRAWRNRFELRSFDAHPAGAGQPQVDWCATVIDRTGGSEVLIEGSCEIRWSHGKLQGSPECKVQVTTPLPALPGYDPME